MANQEHLDILKQGVDVWNQWRKEHTDIQPDLSRADLSRADMSIADLSISIMRGADLGGANLSKAYLRRAILNGVGLSRADLSGANLHIADLCRAILKETDLSGTDLSRADMSIADLSGANLSKAYLVGTNLNGATLRKATLTRASMSFVQLSDVDLSEVKGLDTVEHKGPSTIGIDTIIHSQGKIPKIFLRNAGVPNSIIEAISSLVGSLNPIDFYSCFISYSSKDQNFAERLYADLQSKGVRCWFTPKDLKIGDHYHQRIDESIRFYDKLILILSNYAIQSSWVEREVVAAREREDREQRPVLFPIRLDDAVMDTTKAWAADVRRRWHIGDFTQWKHHDAYQKVFERLLRDLKASV